MIGERSSSCFLVAGLLLLASGPVAAQQGAIAGRVTDATTLAPVPSATISVVGGGPPDAVVSRSDGSFELRLDAGVYDVLVQAGDFAPTRFDRIGVFAGQTTTRNLPLESQGYRLAGFIVTASRGTVDTEITAPSSSHSISDIEIAERPAPSPMEHLREAPGVDIGTQGLQSSNVVVRGFNNIFSGALHLLTDNRLSGLASLRVNLLHFLPSNDDDIERIEVVSGAGSALYGPNTANGVIHVITKSPLEQQGTSFSVAAGEQSVYEGTFRTAFLMGQDLGVKVSGQFLSGREWPYVDATELSARQAVLADWEACRTGREAQGLSTEDAEDVCGRVGNRDNQIRRYGLEARADWRFSRRGTVVTTYGRTDASGIELMGLGAVQAKHWIYEFAQTRLEYDRWSIQAYFNANDAGGSFVLRDGRQIVDESTLGVVQVQNGFSLADGRQDFTYGWDYFSTHPDSRGTIYGDYEGDDDVKEWGLYLQSKTALSPKVDLIAAGRVDSHSLLPDYVLSPRVALVVKPSDDHAIRFAYNRAFSTPTTLNYFLDFGAGPAADPLGDYGYSTRAFGTGRDGFSLQGGDGSLRGMRSPFNPPGAGGASAFLPDAGAPALWQLGLGAAPVQAALAPDVLALLQGLPAPGDGDVGIAYLDTNDPERGWSPVSELVIPDVPAVKESNTETFEVGWSGLFGEALRVSLGTYYLRQNDFVSPLVVETPLLSLDRSELQGWLATAYVPARVDSLVASGLPVANATAQATAEADAIAQGISELPIAVASSDVPEMANGGADLIATYRNVGGISVWGADVALQWAVSPRWTLSGTYSHVSENWFEIEGAPPLALNAPADKATLGVAFRDEARGVNASVRGRYTGSFPFKSTEFEGTRCILEAPADPNQEECIDEYALIDLTLGYRVPGTAATVQLAVSNVLDTPYRSFVGVPSTGRLAIARVRFDL